jgi:hypothetical protein
MQSLTSIDIWLKVFISLSIFSISLLKINFFLSSSLGEMFLSFFKTGRRVFEDKSNLFLNENLFSEEMFIFSILNKVKFFYSLFNYKNLIFLLNQTNFYFHIINLD